MTLILNGTDNSATVPAVQGGTAGTTTGVYYPTTNQVAIATNGTNAITIDASQNVGVGTSSPTSKLNVNGGSLPTSGSAYSLSLSSALAATRLTTDASSKTSFVGSYYDDTTIEISQGVSSGYVSGMVIGARSATNATVTDAIALYTRSTERARIDSSGNLLVGQTATSNPPTSTKDIYAGGLWLNPSNRTAANAASAYWEASTGVFYRSTSSLRYKTNVVNYTKGLQDVMNLRAVSFNPKDGDKKDRVYAGFIAEEIDTLGLKEFVEYDAEGLPDSVAYAQITALLTKAIQEQQALITQLTDRIAALEAK